MKIPKNKNLLVILSSLLCLLPLAARAQTLGTTNRLEGPAAGSDSVVLADGAAWTATANASWLHLSAANQSGAGSTNVVFSFDTNTNVTRTGTLTIAGLTLTVIQAGSTYVAASGVTTLVSSGLSLSYNGLPSGLAVDGAGNVYIADTDNNAIKKWTATNNTVSSLVSTGLNSPGGVAVDAANNVYIADTDNNIIKKWSAASSTVSNLVSSGLSYPYSIALDRAGNVYFADYGNSAIKKWTAPGGPVTGLVGLNWPRGVAVDGAGNLYIDYLYLSGYSHGMPVYYDTLAQWTAANSSVTTLVTLGMALSSCDGVAVDGGGNVYIANGGNNAIEEWIAASGSFTTLVSGLEAPSGVAVDGAGNVYFADSGNNAIKELPRAFVDPTAKTETGVAGSDVLPGVLPAKENLVGPFAPTSDSAWLTISGVTNGVVGFAFTANTSVTSARTGNITVLGRTIAVTQQPILIYSLGTTNLLEGPAAGNASIVLNANTVWTATTNATWLHLSAANQSGTGSTNVIFSFDANPGATRTGTLTIAGQTLTVTQAGSTYVQVPGSVSTLVASGLNLPWGVAVDGAGNVYIANSQNDVIKEWVAASNSVITLPITGLWLPYGVAVDGAGNVYIADTWNNAIKEWVVASNSVTTLVSSGLSHPFGVAVDGAGNVYIADTDNNAIKEWTAASNSVTTLVSSGLSYPYGVAVDGAGNVYIAGYSDYNATIEEWAVASKSVTTLPITELYDPYGVAVDGAGNVYIADNHYGVVKEWVAASSSVTNLVASGLNQPSGVAVDAAGNVYIGDTGDNAIKELPRAFADPTAVVESGAAGSGALPTVLPASENLAGVFAPTSDSPWLTINSASNGIVSFSFTATSTNRTGHITVLGVSVPIMQQGLQATTLVEGPASGTDRVGLVILGSWTATNNVAWLHVGAGSQSGTGNGTIVFTFDANTGATRTGTLTIAGLTLTVTQAGVTYVAAPAVTNTYVDPTTVVESGAAGSGVLPPVLPASQSLAGIFAPTSDSPWLTINSASNGIVSFSFTATSTNRTGHITVLGVSVPIMQQGLQATTLVEGPASGTDSVGLVISGSWTATNNVAWLHVGAGSQSGTGNGTIVFTFDANTGAPRIGTLTVAGLTLTVIQAGVTYVAAPAMASTYVDPTAKVEGPLAGSDALPPVVPATANLTGAYVPSSDQSWLTITGVTNGVVSFRFSATSTNRIGHINLLGVSIAISQNTISLGATSLLEGPAAGSDSVVLFDNAGNVPWTATANNNWLHGQSGIGNANVVFTFDANPGATRTGTLTIGGWALTITQAGSNYVRVPASVTTLAAAGLNQPSGLAVDGAGNVYIADTAHDAAKEWAAASNSVITLAASGLNNPFGVAVDGAGNVYIADTWNNAIEEWVAASNSITTLVSAGLDEPCGVAVDGAGNLYIADTWDSAIEEWVAASNSVTTLVSSGLDEPGGVAVDAAGNVYIADYGNSAIEEWVAANNAVTTLVSSNISYPTAVAVDGSGNVYFADIGDNAIKEWVAASHAVVNLVGPGGEESFGVAVDKEGNVYAASDNNNAIEELPRAFVDPTGKSEPGSAGSDALPVVLPTTENLSGPYAPTSDQSWLNVTGATNGVVSYSFSGNSAHTSRTGHITVLGVSVPVTQAAPVMPPHLTGGKFGANGSFQFGFTNNPGASFSVWTSTNLLLPFTNWTLLGAPTNNGSGQYQFSDPSATNGGQRFYRVSSP